MSFFEAVVVGGGVILGASVVLVALLAGILHIIGRRSLARKQGDGSAPANDSLPTDLTTADTDDLARYVLRAAMNFDVLLRAAQLKGVPVDVSLEQWESKAYPKGRTALRVRVRYQDGRESSWPHPKEQREGPA